MNHEIRLYSEIGGWGVSAEEIVGGIPEDATEITMRIHSPGGSVGEALAIYHALREHPASVTTVVHGYAASSASFLMLAGDRRIVHRNSIVFVHNAWTTVQGDAEELRKTAEGLDVHDAAILDIYKQRTGMSEEALEDLMGGDTYIRGVDALDYGFATELADDEAAENKIAALLDFERLMAAHNGGAKMSTQKTRKEIEAKLAEVEAQMEQVQDENAAEIIAKQGEVDTALTLVAEANAKIEDMQAKIETFEQTALDVAAEVQAKDAAFSELQDEHKAQAEELEAVKAKLANPAIADASIEDVKDAPKAQIDAEADEAEKAAIEAEEAEKPQDVLEEYEAMSAGADRIVFWQKNKKEIIALSNKRVEGVK